MLKILEMDKMDRMASGGTPITVAMVVGDTLGTVVVGAVVTVVGTTRP